jgi:hypothetical protein
MKGRKEGRKRAALRMQHHAVRIERKKIKEKKTHPDIGQPSVIERVDSINCCSGLELIVG